MKRIAMLFALTATVAAAQTPTTPAPKATTTAKSATAAKKTTTHTGTAVTHTSVGGVKVPPGLPLVHGIVHTGFALRYQEIKIGTGAVAEPGKLYKVRYTGWLAADGKKFDSSEDHPGAEPIQFPQGHGRVIPGWDQGFEGMKIGGKRRLFIPYQLAYGAAGRPPVIPAKSDLIFDVELVAVDELPTQMPGGHPMPMHPGMRPGGLPGSQPGQPGAQPGTAPAPQKPTDPANPAPSSSQSPASSTPAPTATSPAPADKPSNPAQPN